MTFFVRIKSKIFPKLIFAQFLNVTPLRVKRELENKSFNFDDVTIEKFTFVKLMLIGRMLIKFLITFTGRVMELSCTWRQRAEEFENSKKFEFKSDVVWTISLVGMWERIFRISSEGSDSISDWSV